jgi:AcrR family transcriptional regulator
MARIVKEQEYLKKRNEILDVMLQLIYSRGYERLTIRDIQAELGISGGAFYHYFASKQAVVVALAQRMQDDLEAQIRPIVEDADLAATEKLKRAMATLLRQDISRQAETLIITLLRVWFSDENVLVRAKVDEARVERFAPLFTEIVRQGIEEASFTATHPELSGEMLLAFVQSLQYALSRVYFTFEESQDQQQFINGTIATFDAHMEAIERMLGAPSRLLLRLDSEAVRRGLAINDEVASRHQTS